MDTEGDHDEGAAGNGNGRQTLSEYVSERRLEAGIFVLRMSTILHGLLALVPFFLRPADAYQRCLVSYIAVSAFRLSQRVTGLGLNAECIQRILSEDSGHYLFFCFLFATQNFAGIVVLIPICLFSVLHSLTFVRKLHEATGSVPSVVMNSITTLFNYQQHLLMVSANTEIMLMLLTIMGVFGGTFSIFVPFMYYRFLCMRYTSQRNPYSQYAFQSLRLVVDHTCTHPRCPNVVRRLLQAGVRMAARLAPQRMAG
ncbi:transmembrane protein 33-like [Sycon ciliatum]|uniref:transmembrane protein 33-like n=1 Tax=Sycon ciliatum TaxID=27933 RepID=UPI0020AEB827|eukprot:scpid44060/ scgid21470/ Transmembrane protein 33; Protein DB83